MTDLKRHGTRIFKKATPNGKLTVYLGKRDFIDHLSDVDPIEGVVLLDPEYVHGRKVFVHLLCALRHGKEDDVFGLNCHRNLFLKIKQVYPVNCDATSHPGHSNDYHTNDCCSSADDNQVSTVGPVPEFRQITRLQERLLRKLGPNTYPFSFELPPYTPASVTLLLHSSESGKPCRVDYELKVYVADEEDCRPQKRNSVRMIVRKLTFAPEEPGPQPSTEVSREFLMSVGCLRVEATLDKQKYYHGESIAVNVLVDNNSMKTVKRIKLLVRQYTSICLPNANHYKCNVAELQSDEGFPISPSQTGWCKIYRLCPLLANNRDKPGLALDGDLKNEDTNLASSTMASPKSSHEPMGIVVRYKVKIRLVLGFGLSDVCLELPFILTHPNCEASMTEDHLDQEFHFDWFDAKNEESTNHAHSAPNSCVGDDNQIDPGIARTSIFSHSLAPISVRKPPLTQSGAPQMGVAVRTQAALNASPPVSDPPPLKFAGKPLPNQHLSLHQVTSEDVKDAGGSGGAGIRTEPATPTGHIAGFLRAMDVGPSSQSQGFAAYCYLPSTRFPSTFALSDFPNFSPTGISPSFNGSKGFGQPTLPVSESRAALRSFPSSAGPNTPTQKLASLGPSPPRPLLLTRQLGNTDAALPLLPLGQMGPNCNTNNGSSGVLATSAGILTDTAGPASLFHLPVVPCSLTPNAPHPSRTVQSVTASTGAFATTSSSALPASSEDDLIFEDFARLRLLSHQPLSGGHAAFFPAPDPLSLRTEPH
nr:unnamed protein product [Spirometra erinaceieuropaei]